MAAIDPIGNETYWINGETFQGIRNYSTHNETVTYWVDGMPEENLFPVSNKDSGKYFLLFE